MNGMVIFLFFKSIITDTLNSSQEPSNPSPKSRHFEVALNDQHELVLMFFVSIIDICLTITN